MEYVIINRKKKKKIGKRRKKEKSYVKATPEISKKVRELRRKYDWSQFDLGRRLQSSARSVCYLETTQQKIDLFTLLKLVEISREPLEDWVGMVQSSEIPSFEFPAHFHLTLENKKEFFCQLGQRLRYVRKHRGFTQNELAHLMAVYPRVIGNCETGERQIYVDEAFSFCEQLGIRLSDLVRPISQTVYQETVLTIENQVNQVKAAITDLLRKQDLSDQQRDEFIQWTMSMYFQVKSTLPLEG